MRTRDAREYLESVYRVRIENLMKEVREELPEDYILFLKVKNHYVKIGASGTATYTRLTRLRTKIKSKYEYQQQRYGFVKV